MLALLHFGFAFLVLDFDDIHVEFIPFGLAKLTSSAVGLLIQLVDTFLLCLVSLGDRQTFFIDFDMLNNIQCVCLKIFLIHLHHWCAYNISLLLYFIFDRCFGCGLVVVEVDVLWIVFWLDISTVLITRYSLLVQVLDKDTPIIPYFFFGFVGHCLILFLVSFLLLLVLYDLLILLDMSRISHCHSSSVLNSIFNFFQLVTSSKIRFSIF
jgi:hypothetical protein